MLMPGPIRRLRQSNDYERKLILARFKVAIQKPSNVTYALGAGAYELEMEYLSKVDAEIVEIEASSDGEFIELGKDCDAIITRGNKVTAAVIDGMENCKIIALGSVGADTVDIAAATARNIPVTNVPDTFIEEVADHSMMLLLATFRRLTLMDKMVRAGRWGEGRPIPQPVPASLRPNSGIRLLRPRGASDRPASPALRSPHDSV